MITFHTCVSPVPAKMPDIWQYPINIPWMLYERAMYGCRHWNKPWVVFGICMVQLKSESSIPEFGLANVLWGECQRTDTCFERPAFSSNMFCYCLYWEEHRWMWSSISSEFSNPQKRRNIIHMLHLYFFCDLFIFLLICSAQMSYVIYMFYKYFLHSLVWFFILWIVFF